MRAVLIAATAFALTGCASFVAGFVGESLGIPLENKVVASKVEPNLLIATDQTSCQVSRGRWEKVKVGERVACTWTDDS
jgi:hypothetical protein